MADHLIYGLRLRSPLAFPELPRCERGEAPDVVLELTSIRAERPSGVGEQGWYEARANETLLFWPEFGSVRIRDGAHIQLDAHPSLDPAWVRAVVLGTVFSVLLQQRRRYPLHAGGVRLGEGARAFVGASGAGKSSLTAGLASRGHELLGDDVLPLESARDGALRAHPGRSEIKLDEPAARALGHRSGALEPLAAAEGKRALRAGFASAAQPCPLDGLYALEWGARVAIDPLAPHEVLPLLLSNAHRPELLVAALGQAELLRWCANMAQRTRAFRLTRPRDFAALPEVLSRVEEHDPRP